MEYIQTKEQCQSLISGVCPGCGGEITPIETIDNANNPTFWQGCKRCDRFTWGIEEIYFKIARKCVEDGRLKPYSNIEIDDVDKDFYLRTQTYRASNIVEYIITKYKNILDKESSKK